MTFAGASGFCHLAGGGHNDLDPHRVLSQAAHDSSYLGVALPGLSGRGFPGPAPVEEICSVSNCVARGPDAPTGNMPFNEFGGYESPAAAWQAVARELRSHFTLLAYRVGSHWFREGQVEQLELPALDVMPLAENFDRLGYDAVELTWGSCLGCSPLSCNGQTGAAVVNRYCLVDTEQEGVELARAFSSSKPEPGPYCLAEVWRDRTGASNELPENVT